ncbi:aldehyde dehydrogenase (NADP(+)) [Haloactinomyces albus]|uniref:NADP-dependent aldehyde dehydrogenase n=1 Tax=Haloactinomyces albus TaxID=1352928 RepID=A0AAE3ZHH4_9ACTN|nr:aldehyde dehydrogenase (NADP(+)) [Haloactinomyces albus]MDR7304125.1 NADP-dependent aldehyde dehydrogenase [Haloactinomyces albus]
MTTTEQTPTSAAELEAVLDGAARAAEPLAHLRPAQRAEFLRQVADALDKAGEELIEPARRESHLPESRLRGELVRTTFQLRLFGDVIDEGAYLGVTIDPPEKDWPTGARPDMRRMSLPLGPVVVFAASNFPFAFSVAGGDTAAALAAGCPVILKTHPGHPELSQRTGEIITAALASAGAPHGTFALIHGEEAGRDAITDPRVRAGAFTGSARGGRALFDLASARPDPIPFYAEMGSVNPVFVTPDAAAERAEDIAHGYLDSFTAGVGQFCTKPGLLFVPSEAIDAFERTLVSGVAQRAAAPMLNAGLEQAFRDALEPISGHESIRPLVSGDSTEDGTTPTLLRTSAEELIRHREPLTQECFGPVSILVGYSDEQELLEAVRLFTGELTSTVHGAEGEAIVPELFTELRKRAGRLIWNGWPTGVSVSHAMQHGGPYPATTAPTHTSVGTAAIERFLRPVCYQNTPSAVLPEALLDENPLGIPRRVNGHLELPEPRS